MGQRNSAVAAATEQRGTDHTANLYGMKHSHPVLASRMACELVGLEFEAHDLFPGLHGLIVRAHGFTAWTVPALEIDGRRVQGTLAIARELDRLAPDAGLFPGIRDGVSGSRRPSASATTNCRRSLDACSGGRRTRQRDP